MTCFKSINCELFGWWLQLLGFVYKNKWLSQLVIIALTHKLLSLLPASMSSLKTFVKLTRNCSMVEKRRFGRRQTDLLTSNQAVKLKVRGGERSSLLTKLVGASQQQRVRACARKRDVIFGARARVVVFCPSLRSSFHPFEDYNSHNPPPFPS